MILNRGCDYLQIVLSPSYVVCSSVISTTRYTAIATVCSKFALTSLNTRADRMLLYAVRQHVTNKTINVEQHMESKDNLNVKTPSGLAAWSAVFFVWHRLSQSHVCWASFWYTILQHTPTLLKRMHVLATVLLHSYTCVHSSILATSQVRNKQPALMACLHLFRATLLPETATFVSEVAVSGNKFARNDKKVACFRLQNRRSGNEVARDGNKIACFEIQSCRFRQQVWTG